MAVSSVNPTQAALDAYLAKQTNAAPKTETKDNTDLGKLLNDQSTFLKMLTTQMQYQDPLAPTDPNEYTKQLTEFSAVEQAIKMNKKLDQLIGLQGGNGLSSYLSYLDRYAEVASNGTLPLQGGKAQVGYALSDMADKVEIIVRNSSGSEVARLDGAKNIGAHFVTWDGKSGNTQLPDGLYAFEIKAKKTDGTDIAINNATVIGRISSVATTPTGTVMSMGNMIIKEDSIYSLTTERPNA